MAMIDDSGLPPVVLGQERDMSIVVFFQKQVPIPFRSEQEGRPISEPRDYVRILAPGQSKQEVVRQVKPEDRKRWPAQWAAYQDGKTQVADGTPIEAWGYLDDETRHMLKSVHIFTVEQLATLPDGAMDDIRGAQTLKRAAKYYLEEEAPKSAAASLRVANENLRASLEETQDRMRKLEAQVMELTQTLAVKDAAARNAIEEAEARLMAKTTQAEPTEPEEGVRVPVKPRMRPKQTRGRKSR